MRDEFNAKKAQWENEKNAIGKVQKLREELEDANAADREGPAGVRPGTRPPSCKYGTPARAAKGSWRRRSRLAKSGKARSLLRDKVTEEEIARIVERWTGIPVAQLMEGEREKLLHLEDILHQPGDGPGRGGPSW